MWESSRCPAMTMDSALMRSIAICIDRFSTQSAPEAAWASPHCPSPSSVPNIPTPHGFFCPMWCHTHTDTALAEPEHANSPKAAFQCLQESWRGSSEEGMGDGFHCQRAGMDGILGRNCSLGGWGALAQGAQRSCGCPLDPWKARSDRASSSLGQWEMSLAMAGMSCWNETIFKMPSSPNNSRAFTNKAMLWRLDCLLWQFAFAVISNNWNLL